MKEILFSVFSISYEILKPVLIAVLIHIAVKKLDKERNIH